MKKKFWIGLSSLLAIFLMAIVACTKESTPDPVYPGGGGSGGGGGNSSVSAPSTPTGVSATVSGSQIKVSWNSVSNATSYTVYWCSDGYSYNYTIGTTSNTYIYDDVPYENNYYKVKAINNYGESSLSSSAYCQYSSGGGGGGGGGGDMTPAAPTGVTAQDCGPRMYPYALVSWDFVWGVDHWDIYRSNSAYGSFTKKGSNVSYSWADESVSCGNTYYYKVKAVSASGKQSDFSAVTSVYIRREGE